MPIGVVSSAFDQASFEHFFLAQPEVGNVRGTQAKNILKGAADFAAMEIHANAVQKIEQRLSAFGEKRFRFCADAVKTMVSKHIDRARSSAMADDVKESTRLLNRDIRR
jgi:hypothetical protein